MKKLLLCGAAVLTFTPPAHAETSLVFKPYIGLDFQQMKVNYQDDGADYLEDSLPGFNIHVGNRFNDYVGLELGYFHTGEESKNGSYLGFGYATKVQLQGATLDALGYLPLGEEKKFELIGTAGVSWTKADLKVDIPGLLSYSDDSDEFGFRAGAGAQFNINDKVNIRGLARYQSADFEDFADNIWTYTIGVNYSF